MNTMRSYAIFCLCFTWLCSFSTVGHALPCEIEGNVGVFIPLEKKVGKIFHYAMPFLEVEGRYRFACCWDTWLGVGWIYGQGKSLGCNSTTTIQVIPFTIGIRRLFQCTPQFDLYFDLGGVWSLYTNHDHSEHVHQHINGNGFGGIVKGGAQYCLHEGLLLSAFVEYMYQEFSFGKVYEEHFTYRNDVNMSGIKIGCGLVYDF